jgi:hypothetical protein
MKQLLFFLCLIVIGCTSEIDLDQEEYSSKMVVDGWIEPNEPAMVYLTYSSPFLTQYDSISIVKSFINHAKVSVYSSTGEEEVLTLFKKKDFFPPFVYKSTELMGKIGETYKLKVEYGGKILTSTTTIPQPPQIQSIFFSKRTEYKGSLIIKYIPYDHNLSYFLFQTAQKRYHYKLQPTFTPLQRYSPDSGNSIVNELYKGRDNNISDIGQLSTEVDDTVGARFYWIKDTVLVSVSSIDIQSFEVLNSIFFTLSNYDNPFTVSNPAITNIDGGIGRWTGLGTSRVFFNVCSIDSTYLSGK